MIVAPAWGDETWTDRTLAWVDDVMDGRRTGPVVQTKRRPWSTVLRIPTTDGPVWFKENAPEQGHEAALLAALAVLAPGEFPAPVGVDVQHGAVLLPDLGPTLRDAVATDDVAVWADLVGAWSRTARGLARHGDALATTGVPLERPEDAGATFAVRVEELAALPRDAPTALDASTAAALTAEVPAVAAAGERVAALGLPATLVHGDLHTNNMAGTPARPAFFDLGDAVVGSPLIDLHLPVRMLGEAMGVAVSDPRLHVVVEAALEPWSDLAPLAALRRAVDDAHVLGRLARAETWRRSVVRADPADDPDWVAAPRDALLGLLRRG